MDLTRDRFLGVLFCFVGGFLPEMKPVRVDLAGRNAIVTGSNSGVGYGLALQLAEMGATIYLACRNETKAAKARTDMLKACPDAKINTAVLDTASFSSVEAFVKNWSHGKVDILAHNAGVSAAPEGIQFTEDGFEYSYQVNFLSSFLLTNLLLRNEILCEDARILFTSSIGSYAGSLSPNFAVTRTRNKIEPQFHGAGGGACYAQSKLMQVAYARSLQSQIDSEQDNHRSAYSWEPGLVKSNLIREDAPSDPAIWILSKLQPLVGLDVRQGSATGVHLATSVLPEVVQNKGRYFDRMQPRAHNVDCYTRQLLEHLVARWSADTDRSSVTGRNVDT